LPTYVYYFLFPRRPWNPLNPIKTATQTTTKLFTQNEVVKAVCSSSEKPLTLQQAQTSSAPVNIIGAQVNPPKQFSPSIEKYTRKTKTSETSTTKLQLYSFNSVSPSITGHSLSDKFCMQTHTKMLIAKAKCLQNSKTSRPLVWRPKPDVKLTA